MEYRFLGRSGLQLPVFGFGCMTFSDGVGQFAAVGSTNGASAERLIDICLEHGTDFFDTADAYASGRSEEILGAALGARRSAVTIASSSAISLTANGLPRGNTNVVLAVYSGDANYFSFTNSFVQTVTNHPPIASNVNFSRNAGITSLHIAISNLLANVSDVDGDSIALVSASVTTNGITLVNTSGYLNYFNTNAVNDEFTYTVTDGFGGTNTAKVSLVVNNTFIGGQAQGIALVNNTATLNFAGIPTYGYAVQRSTNLITWDDVFSTNAPASGAFQFVDNLNPVPPPSVFYRLRYQP